MKSRKVSIVTAVATALLCLTFGPVAAGEKAPQKVVDLAGGELAALGTDPVIVEAVKAENAKRKSLDAIKGQDEKWKGTAGVVDYMQALMDSECGKQLRGIQDGKPYYAEIFVMDNQGANVCMTDKTSDYWQGDEAKFKNSWNGGKGGVFVDDVEFDDSAQTYVTQVSVPVVDGDKVIGAITFGVDVDKL
jgi:hypothetical protein